MYHFFGGLIQEFVKKITAHTSIYFYRICLKALETMWGTFTIPECPKIQKYQLQIEHQ